MAMKKREALFCARCGGPLPRHNPDHIRVRRNRAQPLNSSTEVMYLCGRCADRVEALLRSEFEAFRAGQTPDLPTRQGMGPEARQVTLEGERSPRALKLAYSASWRGR